MFASRGGIMLRDANIKYRASDG